MRPDHREPRPTQRRTDVAASVPAEAPDTEEPETWGGEGGAGIPEQTRERLEQLEASREPDHALRRDRRERRGGGPVGDGS